MRGVIACVLCSATTPARCTKTGAHEVLNSINLPRCNVADGGNTSQPSRQPVIRKLLEKLCATIKRSCGEAMSRKLGAAPFSLGSKYSRSYTSSARIQVPVLRQCARMAACSPRVSVQPVGLLGELTISSLVAGVIAASSSGRSSCHCPATGCRLTQRTFAPMMAGCATRFGQTGVTQTTSSPASTTACTASIRALTPPDVTAMRSGPMAAAPALRSDVA